MNFNWIEGSECNYSVPCAMQMLKLVGMLTEYVWCNLEFIVDFILKWHFLVLWKVWTCGAESVQCELCADCKGKEVCVCSINWNMLQGENVRTEYIAWVTMVRMWKETAWILIVKFVTWVLCSWTPEDYKKTLHHTSFLQFSHLS
jgi:hypothetical protein